ncbi:MAG: type II toxin-antitoxin system RelE/ParE family toxin [Gemmatimonadota bacterium]
MTSRFVLRRLAAEDIAEAATWYALRSVVLAGEFVRAVDAVLAAIRRAPQHFPELQPGVRRAVLRRFPYSVFFTTRDGTTFVVACLHHRRHPRRWRRRV